MAPRSPESPALKLALRAWRLQYADAGRSIDLAAQALQRAAPDDLAAQAWGQLARGFHLLRYATAGEATEALEDALDRCVAAGDRRAGLLANVGLARCDWLRDRAREALDRILPTRSESLDLLRNVERGMLLNCVAGCYSTLGDSAKAFAYMFEALREAKPAHSHGFDVVLLNNLAHELYQLGDYHEALSYLHEGLQRAARLQNSRLSNVLLVNRVICLTDLGRETEALADVEHIMALPEPAPVPGISYETLAIAAVRAGRVEMGAILLTHAQGPDEFDGQADNRIERIIAEGELLRARGDATGALTRMRQALPLPDAGVSLRVQALLFSAQADLHQACGETAAALRCLRQWQQVQLTRADRASHARYQAASLQTELMRLRRDRDDIDAQRRESEKAKAELEAINQQLAHKIIEVQALQDQLKEQAVHDVLTGLYNRRHLNDVLPAMIALARRDRQPLSVVIVDLDHFKSVNDRHGHLAGDAVLAAFGRLLSRRTRKSDVACRYGGEEFCLLLPRTSADQARRKVQALLREWRAIGFDFDGGRIEGCTFSAGVVDTKSLSLGTGDPVGQMLRLADQSALDAKSAGRNRVVVHSHLRLAALG